MPVLKIKNMLQPKCSAAYRATSVTQCLMRGEIAAFMKAMQDFLVPSVLIISPIKYSPAITHHLHFFSHWFQSMLTILSVP